MRAETDPRRWFRYLNRYFMVPAFRLGLGPFISNPLTSYVMVLKTIGRKTGRVRYSPVNYAILDGHVYCMAGWGQAADWYRNLRARPRLELIMPGGALAGVAEDVTDPDEALRAVRRILQNAGVIGFFEGFNPFTVTDEELRARTGHMPVVRIRPTGVGSGPADPGGWAWLTLWLLSLAPIAAWYLLRRRR